MNMSDQAIKKPRVKIREYRIARNPISLLKFSPWFHLLSNFLKIAFIQMSRSLFYKENLTILKCIFKTANGLLNWNGNDFQVGH